jgi:hypothetical protein
VQDHRGEFEIWQQRQRDLLREAENRRLARQVRSGWRISFGGWILSLQRAPRCAGAVSRRQQSASLW